MASKAKPNTEDQKELVQASQSIRKTGRGGKYNFPNAIPPEDAETVKQALSSVMTWYEIGQDKAVTDDEWEDRTKAFFDYCIDNGQRPTWEKYCLAVGYPRQMVWDFMQGNRGASQRRSYIIKRAKEYCAAYDAEMVTTGKMRDAPYIFRAVNYYGLKQAQEIAIEAKAAPITDASPAEIAQKYEELPD